MQSPRVDDDGDDDEDDGVDDVNLKTAKRTSSCAVTPSSAARSEPGFPTKAACKK